MRKRITEIGDPWGMPLLSGIKLERLLPDFMIIFLSLVLGYLHFLLCVRAAFIVVFKQFNLDLGEYP